MKVDVDEHLRTVREHLLASIDQHLADLQRWADEDAARGNEFGVQHHLESIERAKARRRDVEATGERHCRS